MLDQSSTFQQALEAVEALSLSDQEVLVAILQKRLAQQQRKVLVLEIAEAREEYTQGQVQFGSVADFFAELDT